MNQELKPCPFSGQQDAFVEQLDSDASVVICQGMIDEHSACLARGPVGVQQSDMEDQPGRDAAIAEWNRRAQPAEAEGVERWGELKRLAEAEAAEGVGWFYEGGSLHSYYGKVTADFMCAANPAAVLELIESLSAVTAERDAANSRLHEVAVACATAEQERDQLRAEVEALRKDAASMPDTYRAVMHALRRNAAGERFGAAKVQRMFLLGYNSASRLIEEMVRRSDIVPDGEEGGYRFTDAALAAKEGV